jgi:hypothetical protein
VSYVFFYRYANGTEGFGYYDDFQEAKERMSEFSDDSKDAASSVQFGIACIEETDSINWED